jgi:hypothetical protein
MDINFLLSHKIVDDNKSGLIRISSVDSVAKTLLLTVMQTIKILTLQQLCSWKINPILH